MNDCNADANIEIIIEMKGSSKIKSFTNVFAYYEEGSFFVIDFGTIKEGKKAIPISLIYEITIIERKVTSNAGN